MFIYTSTEQAAIAVTKHVYGSTNYPDAINTIQNEIEEGAKYWRNSWSKALHPNGTSQEVVNFVFKFGHCRVTVNTTRDCSEMTLEVSSLV
jgi:hypothetical protein